MGKHSLKNHVNRVDFLLLQFTMLCAGLHAGLRIAHGHLDGYPPWISRQKARWLGLVSLVSERPGVQVCACEGWGWLSQNHFKETVSKSGEIFIMTIVLMMLQESTDQADTWWSPCSRCKCPPEVSHDGSNYHCFCYQWRWALMEMLPTSSCDGARTWIDGVRVGYSAAASKT